MSRPSTHALLKRLEARCVADMNNASLIGTWRMAAAHVSGNMSMAAQIHLLRQGKIKQLAL